MIETEQKEKISSKEKKHSIRIRNIFLIIFGLFLIYLYVIIEPKKYFISFKPSKSNVSVIDEHFYDDENFSLLDEDEKRPLWYYNDVDVEDIKNLNVETIIYGVGHTEYEYIIYKKYIEDFYKEVTNYENNIYHPIELEKTNDGDLIFKYGLYDFDNNGIKELLIVSNDRLFYLLTIQDNKCIELFRDGIYDDTLNSDSAFDVRFNAKNEARVLYYEFHPHYTDIYVYKIDSNMIIKEYEYSLPSMLRRHYTKINYIKNLYEPYHIIDNIIMDTLSFFDEDFMYHNDYWKKWWHDRQDVALDEIHDDKVGYRPFELDFYTVKISKENLKWLEE